MENRMMKTNRRIRTYSELITIPTFEERIEYLRLNGRVGYDTFGYDRVFNQKFYTSSEWRQIRHQIILRDNGCDLGIDGRDIMDGIKIIIHHMNPISLEDIKQSTDILMNPEFLITTIHDTHNIIHYGNDRINTMIERTPYDTCPWRKGGMNGREYF